MFKLFKSILPVLIIFVLIRPVLAQDKVNVYFFYGNGCPHCKREAEFLQYLEKQIPQIQLYSFEVWNNQNNARFLAKLGKELGLDVSAVPLLIVGSKVFPGFYTAETTGVQIKATIEEYLTNGCTDIVAQVVKGQQEQQEQTEKCQEERKLPDKISLPILGEIEIKNLSLPVLTILIAATDGFNPCAMWVLLFLISLLLGMQNRKKMWLLGGAFIVSSGVVYFLFLSAWLNLFLFLGFVLWIRIIVGLVALVSGGFHLRDYWLNREGCHVTGSEKRRLVFEKLRRIISEKKFYLALIGIIMLAFVINLVELVCSAGLPAVYTQILALTDLAGWQYYGYLLFYIFIFMLDDLLIFFIAMTTLQMKAVSSHYVRWSGLVGGVVMLIIGILLLFKPGWLMFG